jgi:6-pyruvoyltetrahydropterin/6-carboxytetrahydropterin synthase
MATVDYTDTRRMRLDVEFYFAAAHRLPRYEGPCFRLHGHNYKFFVTVEGEVDPRTGMIADFGVLKQVVQEQVLARVDHRNLNDILDNPTAENIARWIWEALAPRLAGLAEVRLYEIPDCCVTYRGPGGQG